MKSSGHGEKEPLGRFCLNFPRHDSSIKNSLVKVLVGLVAILDSLAF